MEKLRQLFLKKTGEANTQVVYAVTFTVIAVVALVGLLMSSQADTTGGTSSVNQEAPTLSNVRLFIGTTSGGEVTADGTSASPTEDSTLGMIVAGTATDPNGCGDVYTTVTGSMPNIYSVVVYRSGATNGKNCTDDDANCYAFDETAGTWSSVGGAADTCTPTDGTDNSVAFYFTDNLSAYADSNDANSYEYSNQSWVAYVFVKDIGSTSYSASNSMNFIIPTQSAIVVSGTAAYGALTRGTATTSDVILQTYNSGNNNHITYATTITDWTCTTGGFTNGSGKGVNYGTTASSIYTSLSDLAANTGVRIIKKASSSSAFSTYSHTIFTRIKVASTEYAGGSCTATITFTTS